MYDIQHYNTDGANWQAQALACYLKGNIYDILNTGYDRQLHRQRVEVEIGRYENCREQGYVVRLRYDVYINACYCFFEHRNSDALCCIKFFNGGLNTPSIDSIWKDKKDKFDVDFSVGCGEISKMGDLILNDMEMELDKFINENMTEHD